MPSAEPGKKGAPPAIGGVPRFRVPPPRSGTTVIIRSVISSYWQDGGVRVSQFAAVVSCTGTLGVVGPRILVLALSVS